MDNGNPNFHQDGLINFSKCRLIYNQIRDLILRQVRAENWRKEGRGIAYLQYITGHSSVSRWRTLKTKICDAFSIFLF